MKEIGIKKQETIGPTRNYSAMPKQLNVRVASLTTHVHEGIS
jgi:hypothetical protein